MLKKTVLSIALLVPRKDIIFDDVKIVLSNYLLRSARTNLILNQMNDY